MLSEILILIFDTALYYVLSSYWIAVFQGPAPSVAGALLLLLAIIGQAGLKHFGKTTRLVPLLLPLAVLAFQPGLVQILQMLPAWSYLVYCCVKEPVGFDLFGFRDHFRFCAKTLLALIPGFLAGGRALAALTLIAPYLTVMLAAGIGELRYLRDGEKNPLSHALWIGGVIAGSWLAAVGGLLRLVGRVLFLIYDTVIARLLYLLAMGLSYAVFGILMLIKKIADFFGFQSAGNLPELNDLSPFDEETQELMEDAGTSPILNYIGYAVVTLLVILFLVYLFRKLAARDRGRRRHSGAVTTSRVSLKPEETRKNPGFFRPSDPRLAVRFYFAKFLREAQQRGLKAEEGMTGEEIAGLSTNFFPEGDARKLYELYAPARYSETADVGPQEAEQAKVEWKKLKQAKPKY